MERHIWAWLCGSVRWMRARGPTFFSSSNNGSVGGNCAIWRREIGPRPKYKRLFEADMLDSRRNNPRLCLIPQKVRLPLLIETRVHLSPTLINKRTECVKDEPGLSANDPLFKWVPCLMVKVRNMFVWREQTTNRLEWNWPTQMIDCGPESAWSRRKKLPIEKVSKTCKLLQKYVEEVAEKSQ